MLSLIPQNLSLPYRFRGLRLSSVLLLLTLSWPIALAAQSEPMTALELGKPIERELAGGQAHSYKIALLKHQFVRVVVIQRGIDVLVTLFDPSGEWVRERDSPNDSQGLEEVLFTAGESGDYRLEVRSLRGNDPAGRYEVKIEELHPETTQDQIRFAYWVMAQQAPGYLLKLIEREKGRLQTYQTTSNTKEIARTLDTIALAYQTLADPEKAREYYREALVIYRDSNDHENEAQTLLQMALICSSLNEYQAELDLLHEALDVQRDLKTNPQKEAELLHWIGLVYGGLGEPQKELSYDLEALGRLRSISDPNFRSPGDIPLASAESELITSIVATYEDLHEYQKALNLLDQVLDAQEVKRDSRVVAETHIHIADIYSLQGKQDDALNHLLYALKIYHVTKNILEEGRALKRIGDFYSAVGNKKKALENYQQALQIAQSVGDPLDQSYVLYDIGATYLSMGEKQEAANAYDQALRQVQSTNINYPITQMYEGIGNSYSDARDYQKAIEYFNQVLQRNRAERNLEGEANTLVRIATVEVNEGKTERARLSIEAALKIAESLRTNVVSSELRASSFVQALGMYKFYIDILMKLHSQYRDQGHDATALEASERARARSLLELLAESRANIRQGVDLKMVEREDAVKRQLNSKAQQQIQLRRGPYTEEQANAIAHEIEALTIELQRVEAQIRQTSPRYVALTQPLPLSLRMIQTQILDADTLLLEYSLGKNRSYLWAVTPTSIASYELPGSAEIESAATQFYELQTVVTDPQNVEVERISSRLSQMLLEPVASQLGQKRLAIVADGALQYLPFAALPDPTSPKQAARVPLIVKHEIVNLPSASVVSTLRNELAGRKPAAKEIIVLADPVFSFDDERVRKTAAQRKPEKTKSETLAALAGRRAAQESGALRDGDHLERLPSTRREADGIVALVPAKKARKALDFAANLDLANSGELGQYRYIAFATHGLLDSVHPELTAIALSLVDENGNPQDGYLRAHEIYNLNLQADVVVLSACKTALGKDVKGEGLIGLTRAFMYAGAPRVVASLWSVNDDSTAALMVSFFRGMIKDHKRPAEALRAAQVEMLRSKKWQAPHFWAAFVLQGEWK